MTDINSNYFASGGGVNSTGVNSIGINPAVAAHMGYGYFSQPELSLRDEFVKQHKKNGIVERVYNWLKNITKLGTGSKKAEAAVTKAENGEISEEQARAVVKKYRNSQATSAQILGDVLSVLASAGVFFALRKKINFNSAKSFINEQFYRENTSAAGKWTHDKMLEIAKSKPKRYLLTAGIAGLAGGIVKKWTGKINRIGSNEYKVDKKQYNNLETERDEAAYKFERKNNRRVKRQANQRNFLSGAINGLLLPVSVLGGAIVGVPLYLIGNSLNRYFIGNTAERKKSLNSYFDNLKNDGLLQIAATAGLAVPLVKKGRWAAIADVNLKKATDKLMRANLSRSKFDRPTTYQELQDIMFDSPNIRNLMNESRYTEDIGNLINRLTDENIFAVKFKQIMHSEDRLTMALKEECPPTKCLNLDGKWDFSVIQEEINDVFKGEYEIEKCLGVGTVAETYLAKDKSGKQVCLKVLKKGMSAEKILADKEKFANLIKNSGKSQKEKEYLLRNLDDLADGILKEVNFENEKQAADELAKNTKLANVVHGLKVENNIYVMEKADGISLESLMNIYAAQSYIEAIQKSGIEGLLSAIFTIGKNQGRLGKIMSDAQMRGINSDEVIQSLKKYIESIKAKTPQFDDFTLSNEEIKYLINEYNQVLGEQLSKVEKNGKVIHADIHPGNIFIDLKALKSKVEKQNGIIKTIEDTGYLPHRNGKIFTLIDTGNTVKQSADQAASFIKLGSFVERGNYKDIAEYVLKGAVLPEGMTEQEALKLVSDDLKKCFFDLETKIDTMTTDSVLDLTSNIMREHEIIPSDTQLNLNKARKSAENSLKELENALQTSRFKDMNVKNASGAATDSIGLHSMYRKEQARQEKANLRQMTLEQKRKFKKNPNMIKDNSEDYFIYSLKQEKKIPENATQSTGLFGDIFREMTDDITSDLTGGAAAGSNKVIDTDFELIE